METPVAAERLVDRIALITGGGDGIGRAADQAAASIIDGVLASEPGFTDRAWAASS